MKIILKNSELLLLFFIIFLFKDNIYHILIKTNELDNLTKEVRKINNDYYQNEYKKLSKTIGINEYYDYQISKVLYRDIYDFYNTMTILKGKNDNLKKNMAVINEKGLIGTISKVNKNSSKVLFITNPKSNVSVQINNSYGMLKFKNNKLTITSINNYEEIKEGDVVYTSGLGNLIAGIKIGEVSVISTNELGIEKEIIIEPYVDFDDINYVALIGGNNT